MTGPVLVGQFWELDSDRILKLVLREIILSQEIQMPPGGRRSMGHGLQQFLPFGRIIDLGEFLRQIQVIPADDAILDEPFAGFGHLLVFLLRLQEFAWIADRESPGLQSFVLFCLSGENLSVNSVSLW
jgi:hypothetical protein